MILHLSTCGYPINDAASATPIYNNNDACVKWCHKMTSKGNHHLELKENVIREWVNEGAITVSHVSGKYSPANIFTKELRDGANYRRLRDLFMCLGTDFLKGLYTSTLLIPNATTSDPIHIAQLVHYVMPPAPGTLNLLLLNTLFRTLAALSCLPHAGQHILSCVNLLRRIL
jgi:hypothetical protein